MKLLPLYAVIAFTTAISTAPAFAEDDNDVLFKFDGGIGSQPLRAGNVIVPPCLLALHLFLYLTQLQVSTQVAHLGPSNR